MEKVEESGGLNEEERDSQREERKRVERLDEMRRKGDKETKEVKYFEVIK